MTSLIDFGQQSNYKREHDEGSGGTRPRQGGLTMDWVWEILRYVAAWGGTGLIIWFWYWMFSNLGTF